MKNFITKFPLWMSILLVSFYSCNQEEESLSGLQGSVRFGGISLELAPMGSPGSRITGNSTWVNIFPNSANLVFTNKATGQQYDLEYNPNDFSVPYSISLPFGAYEYHSVVEGGVFSAFLPFEAKGEFTLDSQSLEISLKAETEYGLVTVKNQYVEKASISDGDTESDLVAHQDGLYWFMYVKGGTETTLNIKESFLGSTISRQLTIEAKKHYNFILKLNENEGNAVITEVIMAPFELMEEEILIGSSVFFEENGTIKCPQASPGDKGEVNGKVFEAVDRALLIQRKIEGADLTCLCTSLVTDMRYIFYNTPNFNQPIGNWDVGNVINMREMFYVARDFNQPIGNWDVSKVTDMSSMFSFAEKFNQPLGNWDVSKVEGMSYMFSHATNFNQSINNWDVCKVTDMSYMFYYARNFNQSIGKWDVGNVTNMKNMFNVASNFNQPIGSWNVSKVIDMRYMFSFALDFNQPIYNWCVKNIPNEPGSFSTESALEIANKPVWGTCPD